MAEVQSVKQSPDTNNNNAPNNKINKTRSENEKKRVN